MSQEAVIKEIKKKVGERLAAAASGAYRDLDLRAEWGNLRKDIMKEIDKAGRTGMRTFRMNATYGDKLKDYRWTKAQGVQYLEPGSGKWIKSHYKLNELLAGMNGGFTETTEES